jgi:hypothetical protein
MYVLEPITWRSKAKCLKNLSEAKPSQDPDPHGSEWPPWIRIRMAFDFLNLDQHGSELLWLSGSGSAWIRIAFGSLDPDPQGVSLI